MQTSRYTNGVLLTGSCAMGAMVIYFAMKRDYWPISMHRTRSWWRKRYKRRFNVIETHFFTPESLLFARRVAVQLRKKNAVTRSALGRRIIQSYKPGFPVVLRHLHNTANIRDLLIPCLFAMKNITKPQAFRISRDPRDGRVKMQVQNRSYEDKWGTMNRWGVNRGIS